MRLGRHALYAYPDANKSRSFFGSAAANNEKNNPFFILHVGPPKTATTSLQYTLTKYEEEQVLKADGYSYVGQYMSDSVEDMVLQHNHGPFLQQLREKSCIQAIYRARVQGRSMWPPCYRRLSKMLSEMRGHNQSVIVSEEMFSVQYVELEPNVVDTLDWKALCHLLESTGWQPMVLIGYRRLAEILPSAHQQWERWNSKSPARDKWPGIGSGRQPRPLGPVLVSDSRLGDAYDPKASDLMNSDDDDDSMLWSYTDHLIQRIAPNIPVRVFTIHTETDNDANVSFIQHFFCHVLPYAPSTCRHAMQGGDKKKHNTNPKNVGAQDQLNRQETLFYDDLVCEAFLRGWIRLDRANNVTRRQAAIRTQRYWEVEIGGGGPTDLPLSCPSQQRLNTLMDQSLAKEAKIWGLELSHAWEAAHRKAFSNAVSLRKFCDIDLNATLADPHWRHFFNEM